MNSWEAEVKLMTGAMVDGLLAVRAEGPEVLSVYLTVPWDPDWVSKVPARLDDVLAPIEALLADEQDHRRRQRIGAAIESVRAAGAVSAREWLGRTVVLFATGDRGVFETATMTGPIEDMAVLRPRPYVGPLLAGLQRHPVYQAAIVDERQAWLLRIDGGIAHQLAKLEWEPPHGTAFGGWHGLAEYGARRRAAELTRRHFKEAIESMVAARRPGSTEPVVVGGHTDGVAAFLALLPPQVRAMVAGTVSVDSGTLSVAQVRAKADPVVDAWRRAQEDRLLGEFGDRAQTVVTGLAGCLALAGRRAIDLLLVPEGLRSAGFACAACRQLAVDDGLCSFCGTARTAVPDVIEELVLAVLADGGRVEWMGEGRLADLMARPRVRLTG